MFASELARLAEARRHAEALLFEDPLCLGPYVLHCGAFKTQLVAKVEDLNAVLFSRIKKSMTKTSGRIEVEVERVLAVLTNEKVRDIEELSEVKAFVRQLPEARRAIGAIIKEVNAQIGLLEQYQCRRTEEEVQRTWLSFSEPLRIPEAEVDCKLRLEELEKEFLVQLRQMNDQLAREIEECRLDFEILQGYEALQEHDAAATRCDLLEEKLERCLAIAEVSNRREGLFEVRATDYQELHKLRDQFAPFGTLWGLGREYFYKINVWRKGPLCDLDRDQLTKDITEASQQLHRLGKVEFKERRAIALVALELRKLYDGFRPFLPLVCALRSPHLKTRHWASILELRSPPLEIDPDLHQSLEEIIDKGALQLVEEINEISHFAAREKKLEEQVQAMKEEWRNIKFELIPWKDSGTHLLHKPEPIWDLLDEHILRTMAIASSPYVKFLRSEVHYWKSTLVRVQEVLEEWGKLQRGWLYLSPIFTSPDIQASLPAVSAAFSGVDKVWRGAMLNALANPLVLEACFQSRLMESFQGSTETLERVQRGLAEYLAQKRLAFPRFFFLPNDDLLQILSNAKDPQRVQPFLNKIFEGISRLTFTASAPTVEGMSSSLAEHVLFTQPVPLTALAEPEEGSAEGEPTESLRPVESWLRDVEAEMRASLRASLEGALGAESTSERREWIFSWPGQVVLALDQCRWTHSVEEALRGLSQEPGGLRRALLLEQRGLSELVSLTRGLSGQAEREQATLGALIVLGVHSKDVTAALLEEGVAGPEEFEWLAQLRNYVLRDGLSSVSRAQGSPQLEVEARMVTASRSYGFEYLGSQSRLVITPLTDRCYRTLMVALQLHLGGAPEGPAGTGKTETTKDLAKALAKQCLVFNCSEQLDVDTMG